MKIKYILPALIAIPIALASCSKKEPENVTESTKSEAYPLTTCIVSDEDLGSMGDTIVYDHNGTTVKFCCDDCIPAFKKDPEKYLAKLKK